VFHHKRKLLVEMLGNVRQLTENLSLEGYWLIRWRAGTLARQTLEKGPVLHRVILMAAVFNMLSPHLMLVGFDDIIYIYMSIQRWNCWVGRVLRMQAVAFLNENFG
jgi:hypothetical protein